MAPSKFAHVVYKSRALTAMRDWYIAVLEAKVAFENSEVCFLSYDDEHHRVAILADRKEAPSAAEGDTPRSVTVDHVAYAYPSLWDLLDTHDRLAKQGITPYWTVNHGPTTSFYYRDPDDNGVELQVDNYPTTEELHAYFRSAEFARNPIGVTVSPQDLRRRLEGGEPESQVLLRPAE